jgi:phage FluMu protein gp41
MSADQTRNDSLELPIGTGMFQKPVVMVGETFTHFELRESSMDDMLDAEIHLAQTGRGTNTPIAFNAEMMTRQLVRVFNDQGKEFKGPFTMNMLKGWGPRNYAVIRKHQREIDILGEG